MGYRANRRVRVTVVATVMAGLLTACGGVNEQRVGDDDLGFFVHGKTILPSGGMDALVIGTFVTANGCLLLETNESKYPVVWPSGTTVVGTDPLVIRLPSGQQVHLGDQLEGGGGYLKAEQLGIDVAEACVNEYGEIAVFNPDVDPSINPG
ncbi:MAG: hypothetical protein WD360_05975 [Nitriliruptoraceae bacterium]